MRTSLVSSFLLAGLLVACGDDGGDGGAPDAMAPGTPDAAPGTPDAAPGTPDAAPNDTPDAAPAPFALTSTAFSPGGVLPVKYSCHGDNVSPPLAWTPGPAGTQSYAIVFTDLDNQGGFLHSVIWDIPVSVAGLPEHVENVANPAVPAGAKQCRGYDRSTYGYLGPCPGSRHTYEFELYAIDVATLPGVTTTSRMGDVVEALGEHKLGSTTLQTTFTPPMR